MFREANSNPNRTQALGKGCHLSEPVPLYISLMDSLYKPKCCFVVQESGVANCMKNRSTGKSLQAPHHCPVPRLMALSRDRLY